MLHEDSQYLTTKPLIESSPGTILHQLYYNPTSFTSNLIENTSLFGANRNNLSSPVFGGSSTININNKNFIGNLILELQLQPITGPNLGTSRGWGYSSIQSVQWTVPGSPVQTFSGETLFQMVMSQCNTSEKRSAILQLGGQEQLNPYITPVGGDTPQNWAYVIIPVPWSQACTKKPLDSTLMTQNVSVLIQFHQANRIYFGTNNGNPYPTQFASCSWTQRELVLTNPMSSLRTAMVQDRDLIASYPYSHVQSAPLNFTGVIASSGQKASLVLQQFINSDLCGIMVSITQVSDMFSVAGVANNPLDCQMMSNIELRFNGQPIYVSLYQEHLLTNLFNEQQDSSIQASYITPSSTSPFTSFPKSNYITYLDMAFMRSICTPDQFENTWRLGNNTLSLQFNTPLGVPYVANITYVYNALIVIQNGMASVQIN